MIYATPPGGKAVPLSTAWKLDEFGWLQRGTVQDVMGFMAKVSGIGERGRGRRVEGKLFLLVSFCTDGSTSSSLSSPQTVAERTPPTQRQSVQENSYVAHVHARPASDGLTGVLISDSEYPVRVSFSLLNKLLDEFLLKVPKTEYSQKVNAIVAGSVEGPPKGEGVLPSARFTSMADYIARYQDPRQADAIMKVQQELDETKIVLVSP